MERNRKTRVTVEKLVATVVRHWNANSTLSAAAAELRMTAPGVSFHLRRLHKLGVKGLPTWGSPRKTKGRSIAARARAVLAKTPAVGV